MSKYVSCILNELDESELVGDDFELFVILLNMDDSGEITSAESIEPIGKVGFDIENEECLFYMTPGKKAAKVSDVYSEIESIDSSFTLVSALEKKLHGSWIRIDNPVIGFGENIEEKRFFIACRA
ncbi:hypothetical protein [Microbulbifer aggregans]|uniref:hypothetical protein n=1 Tax=Microbulbifer aggregans TaxID=1769779 RepID=UPI001CFD7F3E|nr:hypothetical protein [Microbulbifer aggregans]